MTSGRRQMLLVSFLVSTFFLATTAALAQSTKTSSPDAGVKARVAQAYGKLPLSFEQNQGQTNPRVKFLSRGPGYTIFLTPEGAVLSLERASSAGRTLFAAHQDAKSAGARSSVMRLRLDGANPDAQLSGLDELSGRANYLIGNDPAKWRTNVPLYGEVRYSEIYPGIDLVYYGNQQQLEYDFVVGPGADPNLIRLAINSPNSKIEIGKDGSLEIRLQDGEVRFRKPVVYQENGAGGPGLGTEGNRHSSLATRHLLDGQFVLVADNEVEFQVGRYDRSKPLVIDPTLVYSTLIGPTSSADSNNNVAPNGIAVDSSGDAYIVGDTRASSYPTTSGAYDTTFKGAGTCPSGGGSGTQACRQIFITKINSTGTALLYSTYLGGSNENNEGRSIAIDGSGDAYITGDTQASNFPATSGAFQGALSSGTCNIGNGTEPCPDAIFTKLNSSGSGLLYSTFLGGPGLLTGNGLTGANAGTGIAVDGSGNAYVVGVTASTTFPTTTGAYQQAYLATGSLCSFSGASGVCPAAFVAKFNPAASGSTSLVYSTYLGGATGGLTIINPFNNGGGLDGSIALDSSGGIYVAGYTDDASFPHPSGNFGTGTAPSGSCTILGATAPCGEGFLAKLNPAATGSAQLVYSGFIGVASTASAPLGVAVDGSGNAYVTGLTTATNFPTTTGAYQTTFGGGTVDAFVSKINTAGTAFVYSTYLGGSGDEDAFGEGNGQGAIAVDASGDAYVTGNTDSSNFPTLNPIQSTLNQGQSTTCNSGGLTRPCTDAFVTVFNSAGSALNFSTYFGGIDDDSGAGIAVDGSGNIYVAGSAQPNSFPTTSGAFQTNPTAGAAFVSKFSPTAPATVVANPASLTFSQQMAGTTSTAQTVTITNNTGSSVSLTGIALTGADTADFTASGTGSTCSLTTPLAASGGSCTLNVTFNPSIAGSLSATLVVNTNSGVTPSVSISLSGSAVSAGVVLLTPSSIPFGNQIVGTTSGTQTVTLKNTGTGTLGAINFSTTMSVFVISNDTCGSTLAAGASCTLDVAFAPAANGSVAGSLQLTDDAAGSPQMITLSGSGVPAVVSLSPTSLTFSPQVIGTTSAAMTATLTNSSAASVTLTGITLTGANSAAFTAPATGSTCTSTSTIAASGTCTIKVTFNPSVVGAATATLGVTTSTISVPGVTLSGTALSAGVISVPASLAIGNQNVGTTSTAQTVTLTNTGTGTLGSISVAISAGAFAISSNTCTATLAAGSNCTVGVTFSPTAIGSASATLTVTGDSANSPQTVSLSGTGTAATFSPSPASLAFSSQEVGTTSSPMTLTVTNGGNIALSISTVVLGGANASDFAITSDTCAAASVAAGSTCAVSLTFKPAANGSASASLAFTDNVSTSPQVISVTGTGTIPVASLSSATLNLGTIVIGQTSAAQTITITNTGAATLNVAGAGLSGANAANFAISSNTCSGNAIAPAGTCAVGITFAPTANGAAAATLTFTDDSGAVAGSTQTVALSGTGTTVSVKVSPLSLSFGGVVAGTTSSAQSVTVSNIGTAAVTFTSISASANFAAGTGTTCSTTTPLAGGATCVVNVTFTPTASGNLTGTLTLADNDPSSPQRVALSGTGQDFTLGEFTTSQTVVPGSTASFALQIAPQGGFTGTLAMTCSGAPSNSTCNVTPSSVVVSGSSPVSLTMKVATTAPSAVVPVTPAPPVLPPQRLWILAAGLLALGLALSMAAKRGRTRAALLAPLGLLVMCAALWASCGGGGAAPVHTPTGGTPSGSYTVTVTATLGGLSHSATVTLNVQ